MSAFHLQEKAYNLKISELKIREIIILVKDNGNALMETPTYSRIWKILFSTARFLDEVK